MHRPKIIVLLMIVLLLSSCINQLGITFPSLNKGKKKRNIGIPQQFSNSLFTYRQQNGYWPKNEQDLASSNSTGITELYKEGFESWHLQTISNDTLQVYFAHEPIQDGTHVGIVPIPDKKIYLMTQYIYSNRVVHKKLIKKKAFDKIFADQ